MDKYIVCYYQEGKESPIRGAYQDGTSMNDAASRVLRGLSKEDRELRITLMDKAGRETWEKPHGSKFFDGKIRYY